MSDAFQGKVAPRLVVLPGTTSPRQVFRTAALALFDLQLIVTDPSALVIFDLFGISRYKLSALAYPVTPGLVRATNGRKDSA